MNEEIEVEVSEEPEAPLTPEQREALLCCLPTRNCDFCSRKIQDPERCAMFPDHKSGAYVLGRMRIACEVCTSCALTELGHKHPDPDGY